jgi:hypothetical protein
MYATKERRIMPSLQLMRNKRNQSSPKLHQPAIFAQRPAIGTRGGILLLWNGDFVKAEDVSLGTYSLSAKVTIISSDTTFKLTNFYGPTRNNLKDAFFHELVREKPSTGTMWLVWRFQPNLPG